MEKWVRILVVGLLMIGLSVPAYAAKSSGKKNDNQKYDRIVALVTSIDVAAKTMVVTEEKTGATRTIKISAKAASKVVVGDRVRVKLKAGTDESAGVRVLKPKPAADADAQAAVSTTEQTAPMEKKQ